MGSSCCKNVRVVGIPEQEPTKVINSEQQYKSSIFTVSPSIQVDSDAEKSNKESTASHSPQYPNTVNVDEENKTSTFFPLPKVSHENDHTKERKPVIPSQFPPIRRRKYINKNEQQKSNFHVQLLSEKIDTENTHGLNTTVHLPPLQKPVNFENDDNLLESVSYESQSTNDEKADYDWHLLTAPGRDEFYGGDRFFTSTPIPPSPEHSDSDEEHVEKLNNLLRPISNNIGSDDEYISAHLTTLELQQSQQQITSDKYFQPIPIPVLKLSSQSLYSITDSTNFPIMKTDESINDDGPNTSFDEPTIHLSNALVVVNDKRHNVGQLDIIHPEAFDETFNIKRQHVIENSSYQLIIETWRPTSIEQLVEQIKNFSVNKPTIDRLWIIFYWIVRNITYDTVPYVGKKHVDKSAEAVFRTGKAIGDGYANLFKRLCDDLNLTCEKVHGYSKVYAFDPCNKFSVPIDHIWNAVEINQHWYLIDLTWGAGHLDDNQVFRHELNSYYFLTRPNEMIYHHFPANERWQLFKQPIKMAQYMQMPKLWPKFFQLDLQLISPSNIIHVDLVPREAYAMVLIQAPRNVSLTTNFTLNDKDIDGGHRIVYDSQKRLYRCFFAPASIGAHIIRFSAKNDSIDDDIYNNVAELELDIRQMPSKPISFPKTWQPFFELHLEIIRPCNTHLIKMNHGDTHTEIIIRAPSSVEIASRLTVDNSIKILGGHCTFLDRRKEVWRCMFAPHRDGLFEAYIMAKRRLDPGSFAIAARFKIKAKRIPTPPVSYPKTWQLFHDLDLQVEIPRNSATVTWPEYGSYTQVCIKTPDDVRLMCCLERNGIRIENGALTQFNSDKQHWQLVFAPERTGEHKLLVFAHCSTPDGIISGIAVEFNMHVTQLRSSISFPAIYTTFLTRKCRIFEPMSRVLKRGTVVCIHCEIPNARQVDLTIDSKWVKNEGYHNSILKRQIVVGSKEVIIYAKYDENTIYNELIKYTVE